MWLLTVGALVAAQAAQTAPPAAPAWKKVADGVEHLHGPEVGAELLRFDLHRYRVDVMVSGAERPLTAAEVRAETRAVLAVNGGFFDTDWRPLGLRIAGGKALKGLRPRVDWGVLQCGPGRASIVHSR